MGLEDESSAWLEFSSDTLEANYQRSNDRQALGKQKYLAGALAVLVLVCRGLNQGVLEKGLFLVVLQLCLLLGVGAMPLLHDKLVATKQPVIRSPQRVFRRVAVWLLAVCGLVGLCMFWLDFIAAAQQQQASGAEGGGSAAARTHDAALSLVRVVDDTHVFFVITFVTLVTQFGDFPLQKQLIHGIPITLASILLILRLSPDRSRCALVVMVSAANAGVAYYREREWRSRWLLQSNVKGWATYHTEQQAAQQAAQDNV